MRVQLIARYNELKRLLGEPELSVWAAEKRTDQQLASSINIMKSVLWDRGVRT